MQFSFLIGKNRLIISTWENGDGFNLKNFKLKTVDPAYGIYSILCETGKITL